MHVTKQSDYAATFPEAKVTPEQQPHPLCDHKTTERLMLAATAHRPHLTPSPLHPAVCMASRLPPTMGNLHVQLQPNLFMELLLLAVLQLVQQSLLCGLSQALQNWQPLGKYLWLTLGLHSDHESRTPMKNVHCSQCNAHLYTQMALHLICHGYAKCVCCACRALFQQPIQRGMKPRG